jgi:hypothetical protein
MKKEQSVKNESDSFFKLWESEHNKLEESSTTIMEYFRVPIKQLKQWLKIIAHQELKKYVAALNKVFEEKVIIFKDDRLVYFSDENRLVLLEEDGYNIIFFESNRNNIKVEIKGVEYYEIPNIYSSDLAFSKISNNALAFMTSIGIFMTDSNLEDYFRHITLLPLMKFYEDNNIPLSHNMSILNDCKVLEYSSVASLKYKEDLEGSCLYYSSPVYPIIKSKSPFIFIPSKSLNSDTSRDKFVNYALLKFSEPIHKELTMYSKNFYITLAKALKDSENKEINSLEDLIDSSLNIINKKIDSIKSEDECASILGDNWNNKVFNYYKQYLKECDRLRSNISSYSDDIIEDINRGHWEVFESFNDEFDKNSWIIKVPKYETLVARDPLCDINLRAVCGIDFGTKSTVVVCRDKEEILLRIGGGELLSEPRSEDYENPTVIQLKNYESFKTAYVSKLGRPYTSWEDICVSHQAANAIYNEDLNNISNKRCLYSIFSELKQWSNSKDRKQILQDETGNIIHLNPYLSLTDTDFDPIEIYAYYLGLYINNMHRGIYLKYLLSFPVNYPKAVRTKILASFERGIKKSLPSRVLKDSETMKRFKISSGASEPAAYAISALKEYKVEPKEDEINKKVSYGVFDFGGGTTDFDFGIEYIPEHKKYKFQVEQLGNGGDAYLGGENLLNMLAFEVYNQNIQVMRDANIPIVIPAKCQRAAGSELLVKEEKDGDQLAYLNLKLIANELRALWEEEVGYQSKYNEGANKFKLYSTNNTEKDISVRIDIDSLQDIIRKEISDGIENFMNVYYKVYKQNQSKLTRPLHILLAGNSCKSRILQETFILRIVSELENMSKEIGNNKDLSNLFKIYPPLGSTFDIEYLKGLSQLKDFNLPMESYIYFKDNEIVEN